MKVILSLLLMVSSAFAQLGQPTDTIKARHGQSVRVAWTFEAAAEPGMKFFSIKYAFDLNQTPVQFATAQPNERQVMVTATFTAQYPKYIYYVISAVYESPAGESFPSNTIMAERVGPPPSSW